MSFRSLDIIHARSNITMADCKKEKPEARAAVFMQGAYTGARPHTQVRPELPGAQLKLCRLRVWVDPRLSRGRKTEELK